MPRWLTRLIAVVTLLTFLASNGFAINHARSRFAPCTCGEHADSSLAPCGREHSSNEAPPHFTSPSPSHDDDQPDSSCPCPGGCAFCSVAKVFGLSPLIAPAVVTLCLDDKLDETPRVYAPPFCGQLIRPPRS